MYLLKQRIKQHLMRLSKEDRFGRFGNAFSDEGYVSFIDSYVEGMFGSFDSMIFYRLSYTGEVIALAHVAVEKEGHAELGLSVDQAERGKGLARELMCHVRSYCEDKKITRLFMHFNPENDAVYKLAKYFGFSVIPYGEQTTAFKTISSGVQLDQRGNWLLTNDTVHFIDAQWKRVVNLLLGDNNEV